MLRYMKNIIDTIYTEEDMTCCDYVTDYIMLWFRKELLVNNKGIPIYDSRRLSLEKKHDLMNPKLWRHRMTSYPGSSQYRCVDFINNNISLHPLFIRISSRNEGHSFTLFHDHDMVFIVDAYINQREPSIRPFKMKLFQQLIKHPSEMLWELVFDVKLSSSVNIDNLMISIEWL